MDDYLDMYDGQWLCLCLHGDINKDYDIGVDYIVGPFETYKDAKVFGEMNFSFFSVDVLEPPESFKE